MNGIFEGLDTSGKIKTLMATRKIKQHEIATLLGLTTETMRHRFNANRWEISELKKISETYGVDITDLI